MSRLPPGASARDDELQARLDAATGAAPARTRHLDDAGRPVFVNRLVEAASPYLLQHAHNPVDWWPWGDAAFAEARRRDVPVFLSVGYATCHWCHVMEHESFEDLAVAERLNADFVPVKVDREARPDVDGIYMMAVQALTGQGGWPMSVWLDPASREPFFAGTYFPPDDRWGRPGFPTLLARITELWADDREKVLAQGREIAQAVRAELSLPSADTPVRPDVSALDAAAAYYHHAFDAERGGFGGAPKFPRPDVLRLLLRHHRRTGEAWALAAVETTLDAMHQGGIYDHLGGGFARYATDADWRVPHFEKMLYDNALLVPAYLEAFQATGAVRHAEVAREVLAFVDREMSTAEGAFVSAFDADSEGEEGRYYLWTPEEIDAVVGPERGELVRACYGVTEAGDLEGRSVLHLAEPTEQVAERLGVQEAVLLEVLAEARPLLLAARARRERPLIDDKVLTGWNGLMISAFAQAARVLREPPLAARAARAADFLLENLRVDGRLCRTFRAGAARHPGTLEDHACLAAGCLDLFEATSEVRWLEAAVSLHDQLQARFADPRGGWFSVADDAEGLLTRPREIHDGAVPAGSSVAALTCLRLAALTGDARWRQAAEGALDAAGEVLLRQPMVAPAMLAALDWILDRPWEIVLVAPEGGDAEALRRAVARVFVPNAVHVVTEAGARSAALAEHVPVAANRPATGGRATAYLCVEGTCRLPETDPDAVTGALRPALRPA